MKPLRMGYGVGYQDYYTDILKTYIKTYIKTIILIDRIENERWLSKVALRLPA